MIKNYLISFFTFQNIHNNVTGYNYEMVDGMTTQDITYCLAMLRTVELILLKKFNEKEVIEE